MCVPYHPGKANVVMDALRHITMGSVSHVEEAKKDLENNFHRLAFLGVSWKIFKMVVLCSIITRYRLW